MTANIKKTRSDRRKLRVRSKIYDVSDRIRVSVFRSNKHTYAQAIDDSKNKTIASSSDLKTKDKKVTKSKSAYELGEQLGKKLKDLKVRQIVFDRGSYKYSGRVKQLAEGLKKAGIKI